MCQVTLSGRISRWSQHVTSVQQQQVENSLQSFIDACLQHKQHARKITINMSLT